MSRTLTPQSTLENLKREAKRWLDALRKNADGARARLERAVANAPATPTLRDVQLALAREHGLPGWPALKSALAARTAMPPNGRTELVDSFLRNACLDWRTGGSERVIAMHTAGRLLARHPEIARDNIYTAVACGDVQEVERLLAERPKAASEQGGPRNWEPLLYLCDARLPFEAASEHAVAIARALLDNGADPNAFYLGGSDAIHYTAMTCVIGEGEENASRHPQFEALTDLLLQRGAEPYDTQVFYNTHFHGDILWLLELVYRYSLEAGREADWRDPEWRMIDMGGYGWGARYLLDIAMRRNDLELAEWILTHGATPNPAPPRGNGQSRRSLHEDALRMGRTEFADLLVKRGAVPSTPTFDGEEAFVAACFRLDRAEAAAMLARHPEYRTSTRALFAAAQRDRGDVISLLLDLGVSPDLEGKAKERALHAAAFQDAPRAAAALIEGGAAIDPWETDYGGSPLGFAVYARNTRMIELLSPLSRDVWALAFMGNVTRLREVLSAEPELARAAGNGFTPLMRLPVDEARAMEIVELFLEYGADVTVRDKSGMSAADYARKRGMDDVAARLDAAY